jgi:hypothetical protein
MGDRTQVSAETFKDAHTAAHEMNTKVLVPLYTRVEKLEKRQLVTLTFTTSNPVVFPVTIPAPFPVKSARLANAWNNTTNAAPTGLDQPIFRTSPDGKLLLQWLGGLAVSTNYTLTFEVSG